MTTLRLPENIEIITKEVVNTALASQRLSRDTITKIIIPESVTEIGEGAFRYYMRLSSLVIPENVTVIGDRAFEACIRLSSIVIPKKVTEIRVFTFCECVSLTTIVLHNGITEIGQGAFHSCKSLTNIKLPDRINKIAVDTFSDCTRLSTVVLPNGITEIGERAFLRCKSLTSLKIHENVTDISSKASWFCTSLTNIKLPDSCTTIGVIAFSGCTSLTTVTLHDGVTYIGGDAFFECESLKVLIVPEAYASENRMYWFDKGLYTHKTAIISKGKLRSELDDSLKLTERKIECNDSMLSLMYNLMKDICSASQIKLSVIKMNVYDFMRSLILVNKTLTTEIHTGSQALPSVTINWKKLVERDISINYKKFNEKKQTYQVQSLNIPLYLFSKHLTVGEMQNLIVATEHRKDKSEKSSEKLENCV